MVRSHSVFAIVADGFDWTSFHGFLAKRLLLRGGRLLKYIGVAAVVAAREISGCGFPAQVAVNSLVIDVKFSEHVFRVFIGNVGHRFSFVLCRWKIHGAASAAPGGAFGQPTGVTAKLTLSRGVWGVLSWFWGSYS